MIEPQEEVLLPVSLPVVHRHTRNVRICRLDGRTGCRNLVPGRWRLDACCLEEIFAIKQHLRVPPHRQAVSYPIDLTSEFVGLRIAIHINAVALQHLVERLQINRQGWTPSILVTDNIIFRTAGDGFSGDLVADLTIGHVGVNGLDAGQLLEC